MTLVYLDHPEEPGLHALVVGVGVYDGSIGAESSALRSAPNSSLQIAKWLRHEYRNSDAPLRSLELLVSDDSAGAGTKVLFDGVEVERAYIGQPKPQGPFPAYGLAKAIADWKQRASSSPKNITFLYFCGHGVQFQGSPHLLLEGFDPGSDAPFESAVDFQRFWRGMEMCFARRQIYIVDACRDIPTWVMAKQNTAPGRGLVELDVDTLPVDLGPRNAPVFYAASFNQRAGSSDGIISRFAKGFLEVMRGPACTRSGKPRKWRILTENIVNSIRDLRDEKLLGDWDGQEPLLSGESAPFEFHVPEEPRIPVIVRNVPKVAPMEIKIDDVECKPLNENEWIGQVPIGKRVVSVEAPTGIVASTDVEVIPSCVEATL